MERCTNSGCAGVVEDGYCNVCGLAPAAAAPEPIAAEAADAAEAAEISTSTPSQATSTGSSRRGMLGAGLIEVPPVPYRDPASAVLENPEVPERKRVCSSCGELVGQSRDGRPGRTEGFCRKCGHRFSFAPKLKTGQLVGGQYEVLGCLAHGGLGWVYLARDKNVNDRWVVLKGLLDSDDAESMAAAATERAFLAEVEHPNIVKIYNFVQEHDTRTGAAAGYIVMEYVGGQSLKDILRQKREAEGEDACLPLGQVIAYALEVLRAMGYLHAHGLLYCDFKPDNAIQSEEQLKLLDLGGVRRMDDDDSPIYGTPGYQASEISEDGPSVSSDLYTVARSMAVLSFPFRGYQGIFSTTMPPRDKVPLLKEQESYDRFLRRATHANPRKRFQSAAEMSDQLTGILREVLSAQDGRPRQARSTLLGPEQDVVGAELDLSVDAETVFEPFDPLEFAAALPAVLAMPPEVGQLLARAHFTADSIEETVALLEEWDSGKRRHPDWQVEWLRGRVALATKRFDVARTTFDALYSLLPGELATKLACGFACEAEGKLDEAARRYEVVWRTDTTYVNAAFGLARTKLAKADRAGATETLLSVPTYSSFYVTAQAAAVLATVRGVEPAGLDPAALIEAGATLERIRLDAERKDRLAAELLEKALDWLRSDRPAAKLPAKAELLGAELDEEAVRRRLERTYRGLARLSKTPPERHLLVDRANSVRPKTWW
jgi:serine/threonine-protein kinase PknG